MKLSISRRGRELRCLVHRWAWSVCHARELIAARARYSHSRGISPMRTMLLALLAEPKNDLVQGANVTDNRMGKLDQPAARIVRQR